MNNKKSHKKRNWLTIVLACIGGLAVIGAIVFSIMWFVPSIHNKVWEPETTTETPDTEQNVDTDNTEQEETNEDANLDSEN